MGNYQLISMIGWLTRQLTSWTIYVALGIWSQPALADTVVTTYVTKVQDERAQTRWTLTEWLRIKERMRMMDLWQSLMTDPSASTFRPELNLVYGLSRGKFAQKVADGSQEWSGDVTGHQGKAQLWVTNLISSTIGIRTLNVDLGVEGFQRATSGQVSSQLPSGEPLLPTSTAASPVPGKGSWQTDSYTGNLRIFGRNIQDSSLVLKYGEFHRLRPDLAAENLGSEESFPALYSRGAAAGAELQLYLFKWLGAEGQFVRFGRYGEIFKGSSFGGAYYEYFGFVEISLLRLMLGTYKDAWHDTRSTGVPGSYVETGQMAALKLQF